MISTIHTDDERFTSAWLKGLQIIPGATPMYTLGVRAFDREIFSSSLVKDDSFVVTRSSEIVALVPLYRFTDEDGVAEYRYGREYLRAPLIVPPLTSKYYKEIVKFVFDQITSLARENGVTSHRAVIEGVELVEGRVYYNYLTDYGYVDESSVCQLINLSKSAEGLWADVRKSYRPLISRAREAYCSELITAENFDWDKCEEYRKLHCKAAGRQTRSIKSFNLMYEMVRDGGGFIVFVRDKNGITVASHFFFCYHTQCLYASSSIDPSQAKSSGIGHFGLWEGLMAARRLGYTYLDMGQLRLGNIQSEKEEGIATFKKGFGGRTVTVFRGKNVFS